MTYLTIVTVCVTMAVANARPQQGFPFNFNPNQGQFFPNQAFNPGFPNQFNQGIPNPAFNQGFPNQNQGFPNQQNQGFPNQQNQGFQNQQNQGFPNQQNPGFPQQNQQFNPNPNNPFLPTTPATIINSPTTQGTLNEFGQTQNSNRQNLTTTPAAAPAQSPEFLRCTQTQCLSTNEYNPVCGSDQVTYNNDRKLDCANQCGRRLNTNWQNISIVRSSACASGQRVA